MGRGSIRQQGMGRQQPTTLREWGGPAEASGGPATKRIFGETMREVAGFNAVWHVFIILSRTILYRLCYALNTLFTNLRRLG
eukprot:1799198-Prymnesium_polylepis.2